MGGVPRIFIEKSICDTRRGTPPVAKEVRFLLGLSDATMR